MSPTNVSQSFGQAVYAGCKRQRCSSVLFHRDSSTLHPPEETRRASVSNLAVARMNAQILALPNRVFPESSEHAVGRTAAKSQSAFQTRIFAGQRNTHSRTRAAQNVRLRIDASSL